MIFLLFTFLCLIVTPLTAHAYIDPGTGSMMLQLIIGGAAAGIAFFTASYQKIKIQFIHVFTKLNKRFKLKFNSKTKHSSTQKDRHG